ncbi:MAG: hypothetical protein ABS89_07070 [Thiobacillus sp. SCN 63-1177]|nr:MAG: hypothetical protein ABS89_07070 [Thiobacillus sp. SCN 63-1177]
MYRAKERGRNALAYFEPAMQEAVAERYALDHELREALRDRSFELFLQSQVDAGGRVIGAEALVRWRHPRRGLVMPSSFIPLAEESGLIVPLGEWVLREACTLIARLDAEGRGLRIAVNVSPRQFHQADFVQRVREILAATGADPTYLTLEITENQLVEHASESVARMTELAALGLRFAIDDFGTGLRAGHSARPQRRRPGGDDPVDGPPSALRSGGRRRGKRSPVRLPAPAGVRAFPGLSLPAPDGDACLDRALAARAVNRPGFRRLRTIPYGLPRVRKAVGQTAQFRFPRQSPARPSVLAWQETVTSPSSVIMPGVNWI